MQVIRRLIQVLHAKGNLVEYGVAGLVVLQRNAAAIRLLQLLLERVYQFDSLGIGITAYGEIDLLRENLVRLLHLGRDLSGDGFLILFLQLIHLLVINVQVSLVFRKALCRLLILFLHFLGECLNLLVSSLDLLSQGLDLVLLVLRIQGQAKVILIRALCLEIGKLLLILFLLFRRDYALGILFLL